MATHSSILAWRTPSLIEKPGRPQSRGLQRVRHYRSNTAHKIFSACGSSAPMRVERGGDAAAWLMGTLAVPRVQGDGLPRLQELWFYHSLFLSLL